MTKEMVDLYEKVLITCRRLMEGSGVQRPCSSTLNDVQEAMLEDIVYAAEIGKRHQMHV